MRRSSPRLLSLVLGCAFMGAAGCGTVSPPPPPVYAAPKGLPDLREGSLLPIRMTLLPESYTARKFDVRFHEVKLPRGDRTTRLWIYRSEPRTASTRVPCVLIAPAGTPLIQGIALAEGDRPEHTSYARAGMVVVAYDLDGPLPNGNPSDAEMIRAAGEFMAAQAGLRNAKDALDYALEKIPEIDPKRIYVAGHSSAATVALHVAQQEPRIAAAAAYAPCTDLEGRVGSGLIRQLDKLIAGYGNFIQASSPLRNAAKLKCPVFLFHAADDSNVPITESESFAAAVRKSNPSVTYHHVAKGGHYDSMLGEGMPQAIGWMLQLPNVQNWKPEKLVMHPGGS